MATPAQQLANAANAQLSTGPRTPEGKAAVSINATRHGLAAGRAVVFPHEAEEYESFLAELEVSLDPQGAIELMVFQQLAGAAWGLRRLRLLELELYANAGAVDPLCQNEAVAPIRQLARYRARAERTFYSAIAQLRQAQSDRTSRAFILTDDEAAFFPVLADPRLLPDRVRPDHIYAERHRIAESFLRHAVEPPAPGAAGPNARQINPEKMSVAIAYIRQAGLNLADYPDAQAFLDRQPGPAPHPPAPRNRVPIPAGRADIEAELNSFTDQGFAQWCLENNPERLEQFPHLKKLLKT